MRAEEVGNGRFVLADPVGRGTTGVVWRAWDRRHSRFCAVRPVRRSRGGSTRFELSDGLRLRHAHLLTPYAAVEDGGRVLLASPLVAGGSLRELLAANGPLAPATVADLLDQLLAALAALHAEGIAHHGIRAGAALLDATYGAAPRLWLAGFGATERDPDGFDEDLLAAGTVAAALLDDPATGRLAAVLDALRAQDPGDRPTAAGAREALRVARPAAEPRTSDGARVVILDRLPTLPAGWSPDGPPTPRLTAVPTPPDAAPAPPPTRNLRRRLLEAVPGPGTATPSFRPHRRLRAVTPEASRSAAEQEPAPEPPQVAPEPRHPAHGPTAWSSLGRSAPPQAPPQAAPAHAAPPQASPVQAAPVQAAPVQAAPVQAAPTPVAPVAPARATGGASVWSSLGQAPPKVEEPVYGSGIHAGWGPVEEARPEELDEGWVEETRWSGRYRPEHARWKGVRGPVVGAVAAVVVLAGAGIAVAVSGRGPGAGGDPGRSTAPETPGPAAANGRCAWQQEGDVVTVGGQRLRCSLSDGGYRWRAG